MITIIPTFFMEVVIIEGDKLKVDQLHSIYKELAEIVGIENMKKIYNNYKGQQISFPTKIYNVDYIKNIIKEEYDGTNVKELARSTGYSERWIRKLAKECEQAESK